MATSSMNLSKSFSANASSNDSLELSIKEFWILVHYPYSDPGNEFEILSGNDLECDSWETLKKGALVTVRYGNAKVQGKVVALSDESDYLKQNFDSITEEYLKQLLKKQNKKFHKSIIQKHIIKVADKETQTEEGFEISLPSYLALKEKYEKLKKDYELIFKFYEVYILYSNSQTIYRRRCCKAKPVRKNKKTGHGNREVKGGIQNVTLTLHRSSTKRTEDQQIFKPPPPRKPKTHEICSSICNKENRSGSDESVVLGSNGTKIPRYIYDSISWCNYTSATRKLLMAVFDRDTLATHNLTGKPSNAFYSNEAKMKLDPNRISDIIEIVSKNCCVSASMARNAITTKCADENKMYKKRMGKEQADTLLAIKKAKTI